MREFLQSRAGTVTAGAVTLVCLVFIIWYLFSGGAPELDVDSRTYICSESGKVFKAKIKDGESWPVTSPYSKKRTGYPAERCYWTKDGGVKKDPTYVLLNEDIGKPGPTICPDCGRKVYKHNPAPPPDLYAQAE